MITQKEFKEIFFYNPETGLFTRLKTLGRAKIGSVVGRSNSYDYIRITIKYKIYLAHRLAFLYMFGEWPKHEIDHINHIKDDNRWVNLREATRTENSKNASRSKRNKSGTTGVHWSVRDKAWYASVKTEGERIYLGRFVDKFEAICCRKSADNKYGFHGNHGR